MRSSRTITMAGLTFAVAAALGSQSAAAGVDACQTTAIAAFQSCKMGAQSDTKLALGKCANLPDGSARSTCSQQAVMDGKDALRSCRDQNRLRDTVCDRLGDAPYAPVIDPANFVTTIDNPYFRCRRARPSSPKGRPRMGSSTSSSP